jgi:ABC-type nitrate/sulfonate/bicarbonate transport system permease component
VSAAEGWRDVPAYRPPFVEREVGVWTVRIVTAVVVFGAWEIYGRTVNRALFAPPSRVAVAFKELAIDSKVLWSALLDSLTVLGIGFSLAIVAGTFLGILMGRFKLLEYVMDPYVSFLYALPMVVILPLLIIWIGIGSATRVAIVFSISVVPILLNTMAGAKLVSQDLIDVARNYGATHRQILRTVVAPAVLPYFFAGLNVGVGTALIGMILGEMLLVIRGLGGLIVEFSNFFRPDKVFVGLLAIMALSVLLRFGVRWLRHVLMPWSEV